MKRPLGHVLTVAFLVFCSIASAGEPAKRKSNALEDYINQPDPVFQWKVAKTVPGNPSTTSIIQLKSQSWRTEKDVDRSVWEHWLIVVKPEKVSTTKAFLFITGGGNDRPMPESADPMITAISKATGSIVAELRMVPNQPLVFHGDGKGRKEDDLLGYAYNEFLKTGDVTWLPRLPMVKSAVKAMDCLQEWSKQQETPIDGFVVAGGSKRGWTTWLTGAADRRVEAIVPIVIDVVNVEPSIRHHAEVYGFWAMAIGDYYQHQILQRNDHPRMHELNETEDPYYYLDQLKMPKYIVNASGDQFFCPDSSQFYFSDLKGEKLLRYVPNADHSLRGSDAIESVIAFYHTVITGRTRPELNWTFEKDGAIRVNCKSKPQQVLVWQAHNPDARDFRKEKVGNAYVSQPLEPQSDGSYLAQLKAPDKGWNASFVELSFDVGAPTPLKLSTAVRVLPDRLPHEKVDLKTVPYEGQVGKR